MYRYIQTAPVAVNQILSDHVRSFENAFSFAKRSETEFNKPFFAHFDNKISTIKSDKVKRA